MEKVRVAVGHRGENVRDEFFRKQHGALGLATGTEISGAAWEGQKVLSMALWAPDAREASLKASTGQEHFYAMDNNGPQRS